MGHDDQRMGKRLQDGEQGSAARQGEPIIADQERNLAAEFGKRV
jgi:hypothetical protein